MSKSIITPGSRFHKHGPSRITIGRGNSRVSVVPDFRDERARSDFKNYITRPEYFRALHSKGT